MSIQINAAARRSEPTKKDALDQLATVVNIGSSLYNAYSGYKNAGAGPSPEGIKSTGGVEDLVQPKPEGQELKPPVDPNVGVQGQPKKVSSATPMQNALGRLYSNKSMRV